MGLNIIPNIEAVGLHKQLQGLLSCFVQELLANTANVEAVAFRGHTSLSVAAGCGHLGIVEVRYWL